MVIVSLNGTVVLIPFNFASWNLQKTYGNCCWKKDLPEKSLLKTHLTAIKYDKMYSFHFNTIQPEQKKKSKFVWFHLMIFYDINAFNWCYENKRGKKKKKYYENISGSCLGTSQFLLVTIHWIHRFVWKDSVLEQVFANSHFSL